jgi:hypothetical protein
MTQWLKQSTAVTVKMGPFLDSTDGDTEMTALTISQADIRLTKNGGAFAQTNNAAGATHDENGFYGVPLDTTDTNTLGTLKVFVHEASALSVWQDFMVVPANVWDSLFGADKLQVDAVEWLGGTIATPTVTGVPEVDVTHVLGTAAQGASGRFQVDVELIEGGDATDALTAAVPTAAQNAAAVWGADSTGFADTTFGGAIGDWGGSGESILSSLTNIDGNVSDIITIHIPALPTAAEVNAEVVDALATDTYAEPGQGAPAATASLAAKINYLYKAWRNKKTQTSTTWSLFADDAATVDQKSTVSDDATTATVGEIATGP